MEMKQVINWGILGSGNISNCFAKALNGIKEGKLYAVAARSMDAANSFAKKYQVEKAYGSYEELLCDPIVDVVYIGTIHTMHYEQIKSCIQHGKSVLCEKPFTLNAAQTEEIIQLAKEKNVFVMEAMWTKFLPTTYKVKEWIDAGRIGDVKMIQAEFGFEAEHDLTSRLYCKEKAGGALLDVGIYPITYACHLLNSLPKEMTSVVTYTETKVDASSVILMKFETDVIAQLTGSIEVNLTNTAKIIGTKGHIIVPAFWYASEATLFDQRGKVVEVYSNPHRINGYEYEAVQVSKDILEGKVEEEQHTLVDTYEIMKIMDQLRKSWKIEYPGEKKK